MKLKWNVTNRLCFTHNFTIKCHRCCRWDSLVFESFESIIIIIMIMLTVSSWSTFILLFLKLLFVALRNQPYWGERSLIEIDTLLISFYVNPKNEPLCFLWSLSVADQETTLNITTYIFKASFLFFFIAVEPFKPRFTMKRDLSHIKDIDSKLFECFKTTLPRSGAVLSGKNCRTGFELMLEMLFCRKFGQIFYFVSSRFKPP